MYRSLVFRCQVKKKRAQNLLKKTGILIVFSSVQYSVAGKIVLIRMSIAIVSAIHGKIEQCAHDGTDLGAVFEGTAVRYNNPDQSLVRSPLHLHYDVAVTNGSVSSFLIAWKSTYRNFDLGKALTEI